MPSRLQGGHKEQAFHQKKFLASVTGILRVTRIPSPTGQFELLSMSLQKRDGGQWETEDQGS